MGCDGLSLNQICMSTAVSDPVALNYQKLLSNSRQLTVLLNNYSTNLAAENITTINAFKIDH